MHDDSQIDAYIRYFRRTSIPGARTWICYTRSLQRFEMAIGCPLHLATPMQLDDLVSRFVNDRGEVRGTARTYYATLQGFCRWARLVGLRQDDPLATVPPPRALPTVPRYLSLDGVQRVLSAPLAHTPAGIMDRALLSTMYGCGLRISEVCALNLDHVDMRQRFLVVVNGKGGRCRGIPLPDATHQKLARWLDVRDARPGEEGVFLLARGRRRITTDAVRDRVEWAFSVAGVEGTPHTLRHSFATHHLWAGSNLVEIQQLMGHATIASTMIYTHVAPEQFRAAQARIAA